MNDDASLRRKLTQLAALNAPPVDVTGRVLATVRGKRPAAATSGWGGRQDRLLLLGTALSVLAASLMLITATFQGDAAAVDWVSWYEFAGDAWQQTPWE